MLNQFKYDPEDKGQSAVTETEVAMNHVNLLKKNEIISNNNFK